jgi:hypothetical protein
MGISKCSLFEPCAKTYSHYGQYCTFSLNTYYWSLYAYGGGGGGGPEALSPGLLQLGSKLINLVPRLKMSEPIPLLPNYAFVVCTGPTTPLPLLLQLHNMNKYW